MKALLVASVAGSLTTCPQCLFKNYDLKVWCKTTKTCLPYKQASTCAGNILRTLLECQSVYPNLKTKTLTATDPSTLLIHTFMIDPFVNTFAVIEIQNQYSLTDPDTT